MRDTHVYDAYAFELFDARSRRDGRRRCMIKNEGALSEPWCSSYGDSEFGSIQCQERLNWSIEISEDAQSVKTGARTFNGSVH